MTPSPRVLVFGGTGFLGRHAVAQLTAAGFAVTVTVRQRERPGALRCDVLGDSPQALAELVRQIRPSVVVNCVGVTSGDTATMVGGNVIVPARLLTAVAVAAPGATFVHLGSAAEYGAPGARRAITEASPCAPISPYGVSKLAGTRLVLTLAADAGIAATVLRVFNPVGPGAPATSLAGRAARLLAEAVVTTPQSAVAMASLASSRDWVDARDVGRAVVAAASAPRSAHRLFNVAGGQAATARQVVTLIADELGYRAEIREDRPAPSRSDSVDWQQADISLARQHLGWQPRHTILESVRDLCRSLDPPTDATDRVYAMPPDSAVCASS